jgi:hypothetical protein
MLLQLINTANVTQLKVDSLDLQQAANEADDPEPMYDDFDGLDG